jgi:hypothetical protein
VPNHAPKRCTGSSKVNTPWPSVVPANEFEELRGYIV